jgi:hypothetical protein
LAQHSLAEANTIDLFTSKFFSLSPVFQEGLYPDFHQALVDSLDKANPESLV